MTESQAAFHAFYEAEFSGAPPSPALGSPLAKYWSQPVSELCTLAEPIDIEPARAERHRIVAGALLSILWYYWCGSKQGPTGEYPQNDVWQAGEPEALRGEYRGHNIAALAVDGQGRIIDFEFNHNELLRSSAEHAEARLVRRLYSLAQRDQVRAAVNGTSPAYASPAAAARISLPDVSIYTTLESCSQCSGVMALAAVKEVIYLQTDPGMYFIGRILRNLTTTGLRAPLPITGAQIGLPQFEAFDRAYETFAADAIRKETPFWIGPDGTPMYTESLTSFLCTRTARAVAATGRRDFLALLEGETPLVFPDWAPPQEAALTNADCLTHAMAFVDYATRHGHRATPHST